MLRLFCCSLFLIPGLWMSGHATAQSLLPLACQQADTNREGQAICSQALSEMEAEEKSYAIRQLLEAGRHDLLSSKLATGLSYQNTEALLAAVTLAQIERKDPAMDSAQTMQDRAASAREAENFVALAYLLTAQAEAFTNAGKWDAVPALLEEAIRLSEQENLTGLVPLILYHRGEHEARMRRFGAATSWLKRSYATYLEAGRKYMAGEVCEHIAGSYGYNVDNSEEFLKALAQDLDAPDQPCLAYALLYRALRVKAPFDEIEARGKDALEALRGAGLDNLVPTVKNNLGIAAGGLGEYGKAIGYYEEARAGFAAMGDDVKMTSVAMNQASDLSEIGASDDAISIFEEGLEVYRREVPERLDLLLKTQHQIGMAHERQGRLEEAALWLDRAMVTSRSNTFRYYDGYVGGDYARVLFALGRQDEAFAMAEEAVAILLADQENHAAMASRVLSWLGARRLELGDVEAAREALERASTLMDPGGIGAAALLNGPGDLYVRLEHARSVASLLAQMGKPAESNDYAHIALALSENRFEEQKIRAVANAELQRVLSENEVYIESMARESKIAALTLRSTRARALASGGAAIAAAIVALAIYRSYRGQRTLANTRALYVKDTHHRAKNHLQIISSLLAMTERRNHQAGLDASELGNIRDQAAAMAMLHRQIQNLDPEDAQSIRADDYFKPLMETLAVTYEARDRMEFDCIHDLEIDTSLATPLCLIMTEIASNSFKHNSEATITVSLSRSDDDASGGNPGRLVMSDNGSGFDIDTIDPGKAVGLTLVKDLVTQISGTMDLTSSKDGTIWTLKFPIHKI